MSVQARELRSIPVFSGLADEALEWLAGRMDEVRLAPGDVLARSGDPSDRMWIILEGELRGVTDTGTVFTAHAGEVTGMLPYSRATTIPLTVRAADPARVAALPSSHFPEMLSLFPELGPKLVSVMADRIREYTRQGEQREKMAALGKLSAGLAHELNNPAAAARRAAQSLREAVAAMARSGQQLGRQRLSEEQVEYLAQLEESGSESAALDTLERSDREQELGAWLESRDIEEAWMLAADLAGAGFDRTKLEALAAAFPPETLRVMLGKIAASRQVARLLDEIESSTGRISELVRAIKEYSYMDRGREQEVDIHQGLENTLVILRHRLKKGVNLIRDYDVALPRVCARGSELNQIWTNLIANAVEAMDGQGELRIRTLRDGDCALVEISDNGAGIPPELQAHIFEPFFTTKGVGEGTGLGLDTVWRIVRAHRGNVRVQSRPGETTFQVWLPLEKGAHA